MPVACIDAILTESTIVSEPRSRSASISKPFAIFDAENSGELNDAAQSENSESEDASESAEETQSSQDKSSASEGEDDDDDDGDDTEAESTTDDDTDVDDTDQAIGATPSGKIPATENAAATASGAALGALKDFQAISIDLPAEHKHQLHANAQGAIRNDHVCRNHEWYI